MRKLSCKETNEIGYAIHMNNKLNCLVNEQQIDHKNNAVEIEKSTAFFLYEEDEQRDGDFDCKFEKWQS